MPLARADVREVVFVHWPMDPAALRACLPSGLEPVQWAGTAWCSALGQRTRAGLDPLPQRFEFPQLTLRTYVRPAGGPTGGGDATPGVYFLHVSAASRLACWGARAVYGVPYHHVDVRHERADSTVRIARAGDPVVEVSPTGTPAPIDADSLPGRLMERYRYYLDGDRFGEIAHGPWPIAEASATVDAEAILEPAGVPEPVGAPLVRYSPGVDIALTRRPARRWLRR